MYDSGREALRDLQKWLGGPPGCPRVVGMSSWICGSGREAHPDVREWSGGPRGFCGSGREALPDVRQWPGDPPVCPGVVSRT